MKKKLLAILAVAIFGICLIGASTASSAVYSMFPPKPDTEGLNHTCYYTWGFNWDHPGERIIEAQLIFHDIYNTPIGNTNILYTHLLDSPPIGLTPYADDGTYGDQFEEQSILLGTWTDPGTSPVSDLIYNFTGSQLTSFNDFISNDGVAGFAFNPDCQYNNGGIEFRFTTGAIPEPGTIFLLGIGLAGVGIHAYRRKK